MIEPRIIATNGQHLDETVIQDLQARLRGPLLRPGDIDYDSARMVQNGLIDRRPALIVRCSGAADVIEAVRFAREHDQVLSVRAGGHNVAGKAVNDNGVVVDLSQMRGVWVDPLNRTVRVAGGATWGDVDRETQVFGLATPGGNVSTTGVAGLTLHGGMGHLRRQYGLSIDNLLSVDIVTADGRLQRASENENADLFWAVRGAGSNFGVVTSFEFRAHPVGPLVLLCAPFYALEDAHRVLPAWRTFMETAPETISSMAGFWSIPPVPPFPPELHGRPFVVIAAVYNGTIEEGERLLQPLRELATPLVDSSGVMPYVAVQAAFDPFFTKGLLCYWKSLYLDSLSDMALDSIIEYAGERPSSMSLIALWHHGGASSRVAPTDTAFPHRHAPYLLSFDSTWTEPAETERNIAWTQSAWTRMHEYSSGGLYLNFAGFGEEGESLLRAAYGPNYERLVALKNRYDPTNLFRMNQNIKPTLQNTASLT